jgi:hypothetical protein
MVNIRPVLKTYLTKVLTDDVEDFVSFKLWLVLDHRGIFRAHLPCFLQESDDLWKKYIINLKYPHHVTSRHKHGDK